MTDNIYTRNTELAGTYYRTTYCNEYLNTQLDKDLILFLDPENPYHRNAIQVRAAPKEGGIGIDLTVLGYLPRHLADRVYDEGLQNKLDCKFVYGKVHKTNPVIAIDLIIREELNT